MISTVLYQYTDLLKRMLKTNRTGVSHDLCILCLCVMLSFILISCTAADRFRAPESPGALSYRLIEDVPFFPQSEFQCGPSSLAGVLGYYGRHVTPEQIAEKIFVEAVRGTLTIDMVLYARDMGFAAEWYSGDVQDLQENIDHNRPLIAMVDLGLGPVQKSHFLVVVGYEPRGVIVNSGASRHRLVSWNRFLHQWSRSSSWTLRIYPETVS